MIETLRRLYMSKSRHMTEHGKEQLYSITGTKAELEVLLKASDELEKQNASRNKGSAPARSN